MRQARGARGIEVGQQRAQQWRAHAPGPLPAAQERQQLPQHAVALRWRPQPCTPCKPSSRAPHAAAIEQSTTQHSSRIMCPAAHNSYTPGSQACMRDFLTCRAHSRTKSPVLLRM